jgi:hypothetical protein
MCNGLIIFQCLKFIYINTVMRFSNCNMLLINLFYCKNHLALRYLAFRFERFDLLVIKYIHFPHLILFNCLRWYSLFHFFFFFSFSLLSILVFFRLNILILISYNIFLLRIIMIFYSRHSINNFLWYAF